MDRYAALRLQRPELFANTDGGIEILPGGAEAEAAARAAGGSAGVVYTDRYITVIRDPVRFPGGGLGLYVRVLATSGRPGVVVLPLAGERAVLVEHYRHATRGWHLEAPRGFGEPGREGASDAARELEEEIGAVPSEILPLGEMYPDTGLLADPVGLYAARFEGPLSLDTAEGIRRAHLLTPAEADGAVRDGRIDDGFTIAALTRARLLGVFPAAR
jgi:ADP-ribose pyrophosphatase